MDLKKICLFEREFRTEITNENIERLQTRGVISLFSLNDIKT